MGENGKMGQITGPFKANQDVYKLIQEQCGYSILYVNHLGIQAEIGTKLHICNKPYEVGRTGIEEISGAEINSIYFDTDVDGTTIIDYTIVV